jgi:hypothetical protein
MTDANGNVATTYNLDNILNTVAYAPGTNFQLARN